MSEKYLIPEEDGLPMRESQDYAKDKLLILEGYINRFIKSMRNKGWRAFFYIDLQAGPGKNIFSPSGDIGLGSPLLALTTEFPFSHYRFVELDKVNFNALEQRVSVSDRKESVKVLNGDCNVLVDEIVKEIAAVDSQYIEKRWPSLNLAFLDPEGLELQWKTVEKLGQAKRMDLIINFSTQGFTRNVNQMIDTDATTLDLFFGTEEWRQIYQEVASKDNTHVRRAMLDFYKARLQSLGYVYNLVADEKVFRNRKNAQVYTLIFASKHNLGIKFWNQAIKGVIQPPLL